MPGEDLLGPPLRQAAQELPGAADPRESQLGYARQARIEDPGEPQMDGRLEHPVRNSRLLEDFQRRRLHGSRPGLVVRITFTLDDAGTNPVARQLCGREEPGRPTANHQHV